MKCNQLCKTLESNCIQPLFQHVLTHKRKHVCNHAGFYLQIQRSITVNKQIFFFFRQGNKEEEEIKLTTHTQARCRAEGRAVITRHRCVVWITSVHVLVVKHNIWPISLNVTFLFSSHYPDVLHASFGLVKTQNQNYNV